MNIYHTGALLKILLAVIIGYILYNYVNVFQQPGVALSFGFLAFFLFCRSCAYFFFLWVYSLFSAKSSDYHIQKSYSMGLLSGVFVMLHVALMIMGNRTILLGSIFSIFFVLFLVVIAYGKNDFVSL